MIALSATLPNIGPGSLSNREDPKLLGTSKESSLLHAANGFYKTFAIECSRSQVSVDMWLFSSAYTDVATLSAFFLGPRPVRVDPDPQNSHRWPTKIYWRTDLLLPFVQRRSLRRRPQVCARVWHRHCGPHLFGSCHARKSL